tara:strand:+ start:1137 stop:2411 length:1275 start_codon:yes stop_codon:yes gene_type:complete
MANAASSSIYEKLSITKDGREVSLEGKTTSFDYYESLLSPNVTATMTFVDTGNAIEDIKENKGRRGTIYNSLPITGGELIRFKISSKLGIVQDNLRVNTAINLNQESQRESVALSLISNEGLSNHNIMVSEKYNGNIGNSVKKILKNKFNLQDSKIDVDTTSNTYFFSGKNDTPFDLILYLASVSNAPKPSNPGYFFYQTKDGYKFKSIDKLIVQEPKATYYHSGAIKASLVEDLNDNKIIKFSIDKNQNIVNAMRSGVYESRNIFYNPLTQEVSDRIYRLKDNKLDVSLGRDIDYSPVESNNNYSRINEHVLDVGLNEPNFSTSINNDPRDYLPQASMRYNLLMSQVANIMIPCNPNLMAGDIIRCEFEKITLSEKELGFLDFNQSGNYLILNLCHHFDPQRSFTSLTLVRDSFGIYTNKNKN